MVGPSVMLNAKARYMVGAAIQEVCAHRGWELLAMNVRTNHVHIVVVASSHAAERVMGDFKAYATRARRAGGLICADQPAWAGHGSTVHCFTDAEVGGVIEYTDHYQGGGLSGSKLQGLDRSGEDGHLTRP
jgi:REP element-mobilizing transposase RayT